MIEKITDVAVAIFMRPDGTFLLSSRPDGKPYPGYWEFPGGKLEPNETVQDALLRELIEELNVTITDATPWFTFIMRYTHATVRLHCWRVHAWTGDMRGLESQAFAWQDIRALTVSPTLPGCVPIFKALSLPTAYVVTNAGEIGVAPYLQKLDAWLTTHAARFRGALVQVREPTMDAATRAAFARDVVALVAQHNGKVLINSAFEGIDLAARVGADGVHLTESDLTQLDTRPAFSLVGASCHSRNAIERAAALGCDFAVLGAVNATKTHPDQTPLGWAAFHEHANATPIPLFAIGGLTVADALTAMRSGAHGIAMQRGIG